MRNLFTYNQLKALLIEGMQDRKTFEYLADLSDEISLIHFKPYQALILRHITKKLIFINSYKILKQC